MGTLNGRPLLRARKIFHFWGTKLSANHVDAVWPYWNLMDFTPARNWKEDNEKRITMNKSCTFNRGVSVGV